MRKYLYRNIFFASAFTILLICIITNGFLVFKGMQSAVKVCLETMIPSLYAMMILSEIFVSCGFHNILGRILKIPAKYLFKSGGQILAIFLFSQIAGYPVGTKMLISLNNNEKLSKKQMSLLAGVCFGGGPAFISSLFANKRDDALSVFLACLISNIVLFIFISRSIKAVSYSSSSDTSAYLKPFAEIITESAIQSGTAILKICAMIIMFGGLLGLGKLSFINNIISEKYSGIFFGILEISRVTLLFPYSREMLPYIGAMFSFGGICVLMQLSVLAKDKINIWYIFFIRISAAVLTWLLLFLREIFLIKENAEAAAAIITKDNINIASYSPLPSILLIIMTFMLLKSTEKR